MKPRGIPIAQIESALEADEKVLLLGETVDRLTYYACLGAYVSIVLAAWARAERTVSSTRRRLIPKALLSALIDVELLDPEGHVPEAAFERYVGPVLAMRAADAARKRDVRRSPQESNRSPQESVDSSSTLLSSTLVVTREPTPRDHAPAREEADDRALDAYQRFVTYPSPNALKWLDDLVEKYGDEAVARAIGEAGAKGTPNGLLQRTKGILALAARNADKAEAADEKARLTHKRQPDPFLAEYKAAIIAQYGDGR